MAGVVFPMYELECVPFLAGEGDDRVVSAIGAADSREAVGQDAAFEVAMEGVLHVAWETASVSGAGVGEFDEGVQVLPDDLVERRLFRLMAAEILRSIPYHVAPHHAPKQRKWRAKFRFMSQLIEEVYVARKCARERSG